MIRVGVCRVGRVWLISLWLVTSAIGLSGIGVLAGAWWLDLNTIAVWVLDANGEPVTDATVGIAAGALTYL